MNLLFPLRDCVPEFETLVGGDAFCGVDFVSLHDTHDLRYSVRGHPVWPLTEVHPDEGAHHRVVEEGRVAPSGQLVSRQPDAHQVVLLRNGLRRNSERRNMDTSENQFQKNTSLLLQLANKTGALKSGTLWDLFTSSVLVQNIKKIEGKHWDIKKFLKKPVPKK